MRPILLQMLHVAWSACLCVTWVSCAKHGWTDRDAVWGWITWVLRNHVLYGGRGQDLPREGRSARFMCPCWFSEASAHKSANAQSGNVLTHDLDLWPFDPKTDGFPGLIVEHFYIKFGDPSRVVFWDIVQKKQTGTQTTNGGKSRLPQLPSGWLQTIEMTHVMSKQ